MNFKLATAIAIPGCVLAIIGVGAAVGFQTPWPDRQEFKLVAADHWCGRVISTENAIAELEEQVRRYRAQGKTPPRWIIDRLVKLRRNLQFYAARLRHPC